MWGVTNQQKKTIILEKQLEDKQMNDQWDLSGIAKGMLSYA